MTQSETKFFQLVDKYARDHGFFLCEFFERRDSEDEYFLCFRPANNNPADPDAYAWRYVTVPGREVREIAGLGVLPATFSDLLKDAFATVRHPPQTR